MPHCARSPISVRICCSASCIVHAWSVPLLEGTETGAHVNSWVGSPDSHSPVTSRYRETSWDAPSTLCAVTSTHAIGIDWRSRSPGSIGERYSSVICTPAPCNVNTDRVAVTVS